MEHWKFTSMQMAKKRWIRYLTCADSFDAMNSNRVYRHKLTAENIIDEIKSNKGKQFDPEIADIMLKLLFYSISFALQVAVEHRSQHFCKTVCLCRESPDCAHYHFHSHLPLFLWDCIRRLHFQAPVHPGLRK
jgi:hypothetical protein